MSYLGGGLLGYVLNGLGPVLPHLQEALSLSRGQVAAYPTLYAAGDRVQHRVFGEGVVVSCTPKDNDAEVVVAFVNLGVKRLLASLAGLERVPSRSG